MSDPRPRGRGLAGRFLAAIVAVVLVGSATAWAVAGTIGPVIFHQHLAHHGYTDPEVTIHAEDAFRTASALTLALALMVALATSVLVSVFLSRRITRADDYLTKPFSPRELMARIRVLLRRPRGARGEAPAPPQEVWRFGPLTIDPGAREARVAGDLVDLTRTEFDVLAALAAHPRMVVTRHQLVQEVWGTSWVNDDRFVDVHISHPRNGSGRPGRSGRSHGESARCRHGRRVRRPDGRLQHHGQ